MGPELLDVFFLDTAIYSCQGQQLIIWRLGLTCLEGEGSIAFKEERKENIYITMLLQLLPCLDHRLKKAWEPHCGHMGSATSHLLTQRLTQRPGWRRDGVSRLSAFHHYGMVSPFKVARDALLARSNGATKYVDEFFTWREVAHAFCLRSWPVLENVQVHTYSFASR